MGNVGRKLSSLAGGAVAAASMYGALMFVGIAPASADYGPTPPQNGSSHGSVPSEPSAPAVSTAKSSDGGLAFTGTDAVLTTVIGAGAIGAGGALVLATRRRRQVQPA